MTEPYAEEWGERRLSGTGGRGVVFRSVAVHRRSDNNTDAEEGVPANGNISDDDVEYHEMIEIPQSTHSLLFTENVMSVPFAFAATVYVVSMSCLLLALLDNLSGGSKDNPLNVPANVSPAVRAAQCFSVMIALTMEEEIPTAAYLLRMIPRSSVENKLGVSYNKFVMSAVVRLSIGYSFLLNVYLVVVQSEGVLDIFYDMLALQFVALLDDIAFTLSKYDILGKRLRIAASAKCFRTGFEKRPFGFRRKMTMFTKCLYVLNLIIFVGGVGTISMMQKHGRFQCDSITVTFGQDIWEYAWAETSPDKYLNMVLEYSNFNGVYMQNGTHARRPIYREMRKSEDNHFETKIGAEIKYCEQEGAWIFTHEKIRKKAFNDFDDSQCQWLLKSPATETYDLMEVSGEWSIWVGKINHGAHMSVTCNSCNDDTDCNLNGKCMDNSKCECDDKAGYEGLHCELEKPCPRLIGKYNDTWVPLVNNDCKHLLEYRRPIYTLTNLDNIYKIDNDLQIVLQPDDMWSRWRAANFRRGKTLGIDAIEAIGREFHGFWDLAYDNETVAISDTTSKSHPAGVDFYRVGSEKGGGPLGVLWPLQFPPGRGVFFCDDDVAEDAAGYSPFYLDCNKNLSRT
ncbi:hypothetical protein ACHAXR_009093 [Thalassiosira sp. AJA248-18]